MKRSIFVSFSNLKSPSLGSFLITVVEGSDSNIQPIKLAYYKVKFKRKKVYRFGSFLCRASFGNYICFFLYYWSHSIAVKVQKSWFSMVRFDFQTFVIKGSNGAKKSSYKTCFSQIIKWILSQWSSINHVTVFRGRGSRILWRQQKYFCYKKRDKGERGSKKSETASCHLWTTPYYFL